MPTSTPERPKTLIREWPNHSTYVQKEALRAQKRFYHQFPPPQEKNHQKPSPDWPLANPKGYYKVGGEGLVLKGRQLPEGILPANAHPTSPSLLKRLQIELGILGEKLKRVKKKS